MAMQPARQESRLLSIDAARGFAMLMVFVAHIKQHFAATAPTLHLVLLSVTRIATPTFLLLSGFIVGVLLRNDNNGKAPLTLIDRALFLLVVGHVLLGLADLPQTSFTTWMFARTGPVEAVAFGLFLAVLLQNASAAACAAYGIGAFVLGWSLEISAIQRNLWVTSNELTWSSVNSAMDAISASELLNYMGIFLIGMAVSAHLRAALASRNNVLVGRRLTTYGTSAVLVAITGLIAWHFVKSTVVLLPMGPEIAGVLHRTLDPTMKDPPSPAYLLFYGGAGLLVVSFFFRALANRFVRHGANRLAVIGRASLMCFIVQDWLFFVLPHAAGLNAIRSVPFWSAYLAVCIVMLFTLAQWWGRVRGNRFFTIGLKRLARHSKFAGWQYRDRQGPPATT